MSEPGFSSQLLLIPFFLQMICMGFDELYFHRQRSLSQWERIGHPLDTLTVLLCFGWMLIFAPTQWAIMGYISLSAFSCLFITKDEKIHQLECKAVEHWLHAVLYILHPIILLSAGLLWPVLHSQLSSWLSFGGWERQFLLGNIILTLLFGLYQFIYWNIYVVNFQRTSEQRGVPPSR